MSCDAAKATGGLLILDETQWYRAEPFSCCSVGIDVVGGIDGSRSRPKQPAGRRRDPAQLLREMIQTGGVDDYLQRIRNAAMDLIRRRYVLSEDLDVILERAKEHWRR